MENGDELGREVMLTVWTGTGWFGLEFDVACGDADGFVCRAE